MVKKMEKVCVITGGGSGMGLGTAQIIGKDHCIIIAGRTVKKLESAVETLRKEGINAEAVACDVSDRSSVDKLAARARELGIVSSVIHSAGLSPNMGDAKTIMTVNALGTINVHGAFYEVMEAGSCLINISSMSAYLAPEKIMPKKAFAYSQTDNTRFLKKVMFMVNFFPKKMRPGLAYAISKNFVIWYSKAEAVKFGKKGIRVLSISPGSFDTDMGQLEKDGIARLMEKSAFPRFGKVEEIASLIAFCAGDKPSYLTGIDILCDGGCVAGNMKYGSC